MESMSFFAFNMKGNIKILPFVSFYKFKYIFSLKNIEKYVEISIYDGFFLSFFHLEILFVIINRLLKRR